MKIVQSILTKNPCYTSGRKITVKGLMIHSIGCPQPNAKVFINNWNSPSYKSACVHGFIDANDGTAYQTLPWNHRGWHCGGAGNNTHIGVEMCEPSCIKYTGGSSFICSDRAQAVAAVKRTYDTAVQLFAKLCKDYNLNPLASGVVISHKEGHMRGLASNHGDPEHLWNQLNTGYTMDGFRRDIAAAIRNESSDRPEQKSETSTTKQADALYKVKVEIKNLNIRSGPSINASRKGFIAPGIYTIVDESNGAGAKKWGKLKSGDGWIALDYCKKITTAAEEQSTLDLKTAIEKLADLGVIDSPNYWKKAAGSVRYLDELIIKSASKITGAGTRMVSVTDAIEQLNKDGIINTPAYWLEHYNDCNFLDSLLCALGGAKKG